MLDLFASLARARARSFSGDAACVARVLDMFSAVFLLLHIAGGNRFVRKVLKSKTHHAETRHKTSHETRHAAQ